MEKLFLVSLFVLVATTTAQDLSSSIYVGLANGTNVGGSVGGGVEIFFNKNMSVNIAVGSIHFALDEDVDKSKFDFDVGFKIYPIKYFYFGINYGIIEYEYSEFSYTDGRIDKYFNKERGFSFTIGGRTPEYNSFYLSAYVGLANSDEINHGLKVLGDDTLTPRMGILLGYVF